MTTQAEWEILCVYLGGGGVAGGKMKESGTAHWNSPNTGATNESGFTALPGGYRYYTGAFLELGDYGYLWSTTTWENSQNHAYGRKLNYDSSGSGWLICTKKNGFHVRCLKD